MNLDLRMPLKYEKIDEMPNFMQENDEFIQCFKLNPSQSRSIEPVREQFLGNIAYIGRASQSQTGIFRSLPVYLPAGHYMFAQHRGSEILSRDEWLDMAVEQHKDGLWERNKLDDLLFIRFLHEDSMFVTQILRPVL